MSQMGTRKRPAPGTSPVPQAQNYTGGNTQTTSQSFGWQNTGLSDTGTGFVNDPTYNSFNGNPVSPQSQMQFNPSGSQVVRRPMNQTLVTAQDYGSGGGWDGGAQMRVQDGWQASYDDLDQRAELAKRDAQGKRKQIPPFIQKLSSFLDESRNTDLIRWSDSGDSFIVLDEDDFAKTLIPELFKHNNYASFVRQLNMYGFHKKVGLSDNSMRASERKNKNPSEYSNPYFKRGRPNLLWLIHKPKTTQAKGGKGRARPDEDEEVDETFGREASPMPAQPDPMESGTGYRARQQPLLTMGNMADRLPQDEVAVLKRELKAVQDNQKMIKEMLTQTRREHQQLYGQAKAFHELHEKHDNSINAILQFLATVYNKNLAAGQTGSGDMFPGKLQAGDPPRGNVVDMGEDKARTSQPFRRPQLLLEHTSQSPTASSDTTGFKPGRGDPDKIQPLHSPAIQELSDYSPSNRSSESPPASHETVKPETKRPIPEADILRMMNNASAQSNALQRNNSNTHVMDFPEALTHLQNSDGQTPLTPNQRQNMLQLMANEHSAASPVTVDSATGNGLTSYAPPASTSDLASNFDLTTEQLNQIQQSLRDQDERMANLQSTIAPLSPSGSIPGVNDNSPPPAFNPAYNPDLYDIDQIFNSGDYFNDVNVDGADLPDFDFSATTPPGGVGGGDGEGGEADTGTGGFDPSSFNTSTSGVFDPADTTPITGDVETISSAVSTPADGVVGAGASEADAGEMGSPGGGSVGVGSRSSQRAAPSGGGGGSRTGQR